MEKFGYIYKTTNLVNNKIYIGQHKVSAIDKHYIGSGTLLKRAFKKYSKESFTNEILQYAYSQEELNELEREYIAKFNSTNLEIGYNVDSGGGGGNIISQLPPEQYNKVIATMRTNNSGISNPNYGNGDKIRGDKNPSKRPEVRAKLSRALTGSKNGNYGKRYSLPNKKRHLETCKECGVDFLTQAGNRQLCCICKFVKLVESKCTPRPRTSTDHDGVCVLCGDAFAKHTRSSKFCNRCIKNARKIPRQATP